MSKLVKAIIFLLFVFGGALSWEVGYFLLSSPGEESEVVRVEVPPGMTLYTLSGQLEENKLVFNAQWLRLLAKLRGQASGLRVGEYDLHRGMTPIELLNHLTSGRSVEYSITFQEGINSVEMGELLESRGLGKKAEFLRWANDSEFIQELLGDDPSDKDPTSLEGYLFPETYNITKFTGEKALLSMMVRKFLSVYQEVVAEGGGLKIPRHRHVTLASIIEKETGAPEERPLIAAVFHNRLNKSMRLQSDPTILYGIFSQSGVMKKNITKQDVTAFTAYNTYRINGLPPGPIANPGREALWATINPAASGYLYFVSKNDGTHVFSETYEGHLKNVQQFQLNRKAREGKSWRDLSKKVTQ